MRARTFFWCTIIVQAGTIAVLGLWARSHVVGAELPQPIDQFVTAGTTAGFFGYPVVTFVAASRARLLEHDLFSVCLLQAALSVAYLLAMSPGPP